MDMWPISDGKNEILIGYYIPYYIVSTDESPHILYSNTHNYIWSSLSPFDLLKKIT
jgi:hypothetical protein